MMYKFFQDKTDEEKIKSDITKLKTFLDGDGGEKRPFNFSALRAIKVQEENKENFHRASDTAVQELYDFFCNNFLNGESKALYTNMKSWPRDKSKYVSGLADLFLQFRNQLEASNMAYFREQGKDEILGKLKENSQWVRAFQFTIEQHMSDIKVRGNYRHFIKNLQNMGENIYRWLQKNDKQNCEKYKFLQSMDDLPNQSENEKLQFQGIKKKLF